MERSDEWYNSVYFRWTLLPIVAHILSWMTGIMGYLLFPILVTIAQYLIFKIHPAINRAGPWFFTLPITFFIWVKWGPFVTDMQEHNILPGVVAYYAGQLLNTLFIPLIVRPDQRIMLINWLGANVGAVSIWAIVYKALVLMIPDWNDHHGFSFSVVLTVYSAIGLIANGISGFFWSNKLIVSDY